MVNFKDRIEDLGVIVYIYLDLLKEIFIDVEILFGLNVFFYVYV